VTLVQCRIMIDAGCYKRAVTHSSVCDVLQRALSDSLCKLEFTSPDEDVMVAEVAVWLKSRFRYWGHNEVIRDRIITALMERLQPEYESQVEVEIIDGPDDSTDFG